MDHDWYTTSDDIPEPRPGLCEHHGTKSNLTKLAVMMIVLGLISFWPDTTRAERHAACRYCSRFFVVSEFGAGFVRDLNIACGRCRFMRGEHGWFVLDEHRYVTFADGTLIDMKHFRAAMLIAMSARFSNPVTGMLMANGLGWLVEWNQLRNGNPSGHPYGGNEDLLSNFHGSLFGVGYTPLPGGNDWAQSALPWLEMFHGRATGVSNTKPNE